MGDDIYTKEELETILMNLDRSKELLRESYEDFGMYLDKLSNDIENLKTVVARG